MTRRFEIFLLSSRHPPTSFYLSHFLPHTCRSLPQHNGQLSSPYDTISTRFFLSPPFLSPSSLHLLPVHQYSSASHAQIYMYTQKEGRKENPVFPGAINAGGGLTLAETEAVGKEAPKTSAPSNRACLGSDARPRRRLLHGCVRYITFRRFKGSRRFAGCGSLRRDARRPSPGAPLLLLLPP